MAIQDDTTDPTSAGTTRQATLARVWADVLGVNRVGLDDDFFVLGGDSIMAIRAIVEAETRGVSVNLADLFERPTIRQLAPDADEAPHAVETPRSTQPVTQDLVSPDDAAKLPPTVERAYPATHLQQGLIFEAMLHDESLYHDVISRRITLPFDEGAMRRALEALSDRHEALRTSINVTDYSMALQLVGRSAVPPLRTTEARGRDAAEFLRADVAYASEPFELEHAPLLRVAVTVLSEHSFQLTYGFHHAIMDGWSENVFITELMSRYAAFRLGTRPAPADPLPDMVRFIERECEAVESPASREYWLARAADVPAVAEPTARSTDRHRLSVPIPPDMRERITAFGADTRVPTKSILLAAHLAARHAQYGGALPVTGLVSNGRLEEAGGDRMIGLFLNILPLAVPVVGDTVQFVRQVLQAERDAFWHRRFPYAEMTRLSGRPLVDTTFNYVHFRMERQLRSSGWLQGGSLEIYDKISFPLVVDAVQDPDSDELRLDFSADTAVWAPDQLRTIAALHSEMLERICRRQSSEPIPDAR
ncbi:condensation domain-containing protein [Micromonospora arborensis]|uniref:condensation domain-containing protein n=1 Tax=Micromonospora arborensis TaxID=2116518 RepID=UPI0033F92EC6